MTNRPDQAASIAAHSTDGCAGNGPTAPRVSVVLPCYNRAWSVAPDGASVLA